MVQYSECTKDLRQLNLGYPSYESEDGNATYLSEKDFYRTYEKSPQAHQLYVVMSEEKALESMGEKLLETLAEKIEDPQGLEAFGHDAYWVPACCLS